MLPNAVALSVHSAAAVTLPFYSLSRRRRNQSGRRRHLPPSLPRPNANERLGADIPLGTKISLSKQSRVIRGLQLCSE